MTRHARGHHRGTEDTAREIIHEDVEMLRRFGAASLTVVFELPLSDVTVVDGEKPRSGHARRRCHVVRQHVVHGARSARRHRLLSDEVSDMTRSSVALSWLAPTSSGGAAIVAYVIERPEHLSPTWTTNSASAS